MGILETAESSPPFFLSVFFPSNITETRRKGASSVPCLRCVLFQGVRREQDGRAGNCGSVLVTCDQWPLGLLGLHPSVLHLCLFLRGDSIGATKKPHFTHFSVNRPLGPTLILLLFPVSVGDCGRALAARPLRLIFKWTCSFSSSLGLLPNPSPSNLRGNRTAFFPGLGRSLVLEHTATRRGSHPDFGDDPRRSQRGLSPRVTRELQLQQRTENGAFESPP